MFPINELIFHDSALTLHTEILFPFYTEVEFSNRKETQPCLWICLFLKCIKLFWKQDSPVENIYLLKRKESLACLPFRTQHLCTFRRRESLDQRQEVMGCLALFFRKKSKKRKGKKPKQHRRWFHSLGIVYWRSRGKKVQKHCSTYLRSSLYL